MVYYNIEPFGERAAYWRAGQIAATIANVNRRKKSDRVLLPEDFMPKESKAESRMQSVEEMAVVLRQAFKHAKQHGMTKEKDK